jgi:hypothetical protein
MRMGNLNLEARGEIDQQDERHHREHSDPQAGGGAVNGLIRRI